jgi:prepilin-type N-terminal cleavage/methylation domain-containing protein
MRPRRSHRRQAGFTLMEVLVAIVIFAISVVGLVAMEARSAEAQRASSLLREGERVAQDTMAELTSRGFVQLLSYDFEGALGPSIPYNDTPIDPLTRLRDFRRPPADIPDATVVPASIRGAFIVWRQVDWITDIANPPSANPPDLAVDIPRINALVVDVTVMWIDDSNPTMPPPAGLTVDQLTPDMVDPASVTFAPYVGAVQLRTVRSNDAIVVVP